MARRKTSRSRWLGLLLLLLLGYVAIFVVWSRLHSRGVDVLGRTMWSFFAPPTGVPMVSPQSWRTWKRNETIAATVFWPCVLADEKFTKRRYWPGIGQ